jgi:hypothetical protein
MMMAKAAKLQHKIGYMTQPPRSMRSIKTSI